MLPLGAIRFSMPVRLNRTRPPLIGAVFLPRFAHSDMFVCLFASASGLRVADCERCDDVVRDPVARCGLGGQGRSPSRSALAALRPVSGQCTPCPIYACTIAAAWHLACGLHRIVAAVSLGACIIFFLAVH